ncbi:hypothetical protein ACTU44_20405 [Thalassospira sp. SM2505]
MPPVFLPGCKRVFASSKVGIRSDSSRRYRLRSCRAGMFQVACQIKVTGRKIIFLSLSNHLSVTAELQAALVMSAWKIVFSEMLDAAGCDSSPDKFPLPKPKIDHSHTLRPARLSVSGVSRWLGGKVKQKISRKIRIENDLLKISLRAESVGFASLRGDIYG